MKTAQQEENSIVPKIGLLAPKDIKLHIEQMEEVRGLINTYIEKNLASGIDYGAIHISKNCQNKYNCTNKGHLSKPCLFKPGSEKMTTLFQLRAVFSIDEDSRKMAGEPKGTYFYKCELIDKNDHVWGEGRGACNTTSFRDDNNSIKIGQKRAQVDATLRVFALSERFTQDLEDKPTNGAKASLAPPTEPEKAAPEPMTQAQEHRICQLADELGSDALEVWKWITNKYGKEPSEEDVWKVIDMMEKKLEANVTGSQNIAISDEPLIPAQTKKGKNMKKPDEVEIDPEKAVWVDPVLPDQESNAAKLMKQGGYNPK